MYWNPITIRHPDNISVILTTSCSLEILQAPITYTYTRLRIRNHLQIESQATRNYHNPKNTNLPPLRNKLNSQVWVVLLITL